jgi:branched-chain amino acid transport system substrate-binding protein
MDDFLKHYPKIKKVVVMGDVREASGKAAVELWVELAKAKGLTLLDTITYTTGTTDFSPSAIKVKELNPDAILISTITPDALRLGREFKTQGVDVPILANSLLWPGTLPQALSKTIGKEAANWHTTGFSTNEESNGDPVLYKSFVKRYTEEVLKNPAMAQFTPPNLANSTLGYDVVLLMADILKKKGVDGNTPPEKARLAMQEGMMELKEFRGLNAYKIRDTGDGYIPMHALHINPETGEWAFLK